MHIRKSCLQHLATLQKYISTYSSLQFLAEIKTSCKTPTIFITRHINYDYGADLRVITTWFLGKHFYYSV